MKHNHRKEEERNAAPAQKGHEPHQERWVSQIIYSNWRCFPPPPFGCCCRSPHFGGVVPCSSLLGRCCHRPPHHWVMVLLPLQQKTWLCYLHRWNQVITQEGKSEKTPPSKRRRRRKQHHPREGGEMQHQPEGGWLSPFPLCVWWCFLSLSSFGWWCLLHAPFDMLQYVLLNWILSVSWNKRI